MFETIHVCIQMFGFCSIVIGRIKATDSHRVEHREKVN